MLRIQSAFAALCLASTMALSSTAGAAPVTYNIAVSGGWFDDHGSPWGMGLSPTLAGSITVDSSISGIAGMVDFSLTTGSKTWTEDDFVGSIGADLFYDSVGTLILFNLFGFRDGSGYMNIHSNNTMSIQDNFGATNACNGCVSFALANQVPEPASLSLIALGLLGLAGRRKIFWKA